MIKARLLTSQHEVRTGVSVEIGMQASMVLLVLSSTMAVSLGFRWMSILSSFSHLNISDFLHVRCISPCYMRPIMPHEASTPACFKPLPAVCRPMMHLVLKFLSRGCGETTSSLSISRTNTPEMCFQSSLWNFNDIVRKDSHTFQGLFAPLV